MQICEDNIPKDSTLDKCTIPEDGEEDGLRTCHIERETETYDCYVAEYTGEFACSSDNCTVVCGKKPVCWGCMGSSFVGLEKKNDDPRGFHVYCGNIEEDPLATMSCIDEIEDACCTMIEKSTTEGPVTTETPVSEDECMNKMKKCVKEGASNRGAQITCKGDEKCSFKCGDDDAACETECSNLNSEERCASERPDSVVLIIAEKEDIDKRCFPWDCDNFDEIRKCIKENCMTGESYIDTVKCEEGGKCEVSCGKVERNGDGDRNKPCEKDKIGACGKCFESMPTKTCNEDVGKLWCGPKNDNNKFAAEYDIGDDRPATPQDKGFPDKNDVSKSCFPWCDKKNNNPSKNCFPDCKVDAGIECIKTNCLETSSYISNISCTNGDCKVKCGSGYNGKDIPGKIDQICDDAGKCECFSGEKCGEDLTERWCSGENANKNFQNFPGDRHPNDLGAYVNGNSPMEECFPWCETSK